MIQLRFDVVYMSILGDFGICNFYIFYSILFDMCEEESRELSESRKGHIDF